MVLHYRLDAPSDIADAVGSLAIYLVVMLEDAALAWLVKLRSHLRGEIGPECLPLLIAEVASMFLAHALVYDAGHFFYCELFSF